MAPSKKPTRGRPPNGLTEQALTIRGPAILFAAAAHLAEREGITVSEWWRRAARLRLGWHEILPEDKQK